MAPAFRFLLALLLLFACSGRTTVESSNETITTPSTVTITTPLNVTTTTPLNVTTATPSNVTTATPSNETTTTPSNETTTTPSNETITTPSNETTTTPSTGTTATPSNETTATPSNETTTNPSTGTTATPSNETTTTPSNETTATPSNETTTTPSTGTTATPSNETTATPSNETTTTPSTGTTATPSNETTATPSNETTTTPSTGTTATPSNETTTTPSNETTTTPSNETTTTPSTGTTATPSNETTATPSNETTTTPSNETITTPSTGTTATPSNETTTTPSTGTTATPSNETITTPSNETTATPSNETTATPSPGPVVTTPTAPPPNSCLSQPCGRGATCEDRGDGDFECLCLPGDYFNGSCQAAKVFPGELTSPGLVFNETLRDKTSELFKNTSRDVTRDIGIAFKDDVTYITSTVIEFRESQSTRQASPAIASVQIIFQQASNTTNSTVETLLNECNDCTLLKDATFNASPLCNSIPCDETTTTCVNGDGNYTCPCREGYITTNFADRTCIVACPSGGQFVDNKCIDCPFGYSGFNCSENWQLVLLIVGIVLGALLLITIILLITGAVRLKKHRKASSTADIGTPFISHPSTKAPLINGNKGVPALAGMPRIPRASAQNSSYNSTNLEMTPSNSRQNLITNGRNPRQHEDYGHSRPQNNPYTQIRPVSSSYTPKQGMDNPYYKYDSR